MTSILLRRIAAYLLDILLLFVVLAPAGYVVQRAFDVSPVSARDIYVVLILNFSIPVWAYFTISDYSVKGATLGKRAMSIKTVTVEGNRMRPLQALGRTAIKMLPWEVSHASAFLFVPSLGEFGIGNWLGIGISYALSLAYFLVVWRTKGRRSIHDIVFSTDVQRSVQIVPESAV